MSKNTNCNLQALHPEDNSIVGPDIDLPAWIMHQHEETINRFAAFNSRDMFRSIIKHINNLKLIASGMRDEFISGNPLIVEYLEELPQSQPTSPTSMLAATPQEENSTFDGIQNQSSSQLGKFRRNSSATGTSDWTELDKGEKTVLSKDNKRTNGHEDVLDSSFSSTCSSSTVLLENSTPTKIKFGLSKRDKTSHKPEEVQVPEVIPATGDLEDISSEEDYTLSIPETEVMFQDNQNGAVIRETERTAPMSKEVKLELNNMYDTSLSVDKPLVNDILPNCFPEQEQDTLMNSKEIEHTQINNDVPKISKVKPDKSVDSNFTKVVYSNSEPAVAAMKYEEFGDAIPTAAEAQNTEFDEQDNFEESFPIIVKNKPLITSSQENELFQTSPGYSSLPWRQNDCEVVDDQMPSTSRSSSTVNILNLIKRDNKLGEKVCRVLMEKLGPVILDELKKNKPFKNRRKKSTEDAVDAAIRRLFEDTSNRKVTKPKSANSRKTRCVRSSPEDNSESVFEFDENISEEDESDFDSRNHLTDSDDSLLSSEVSVIKERIDETSDENEVESDDDLSCGESGARDIILRSRTISKIGGKSTSTKIQVPRYFTPYVRSVRTSQRRARTTRKSKSTDQISGDVNKISTGIQQASHIKKLRRISSSGENWDKCPSPNVTNRTSTDIGTIKLKKRIQSADEWEVHDQPRTKRNRQNNVSGSSSSDEDETESPANCIDLSCSEDSDVQEVTLAESQLPVSYRRNIRPVMGDDELNPATRQAENEEQIRKRRLEERSKLNFMSPRDDSNVPELILDQDLTSTVSVHKAILSKLKPHQRSGLKFMWDTCVESMSVAKENPGTGCILAHCMGLGKTIQTLGFIHTIFTHEFLNFKSALVVCPKNTVNNWKDECQYWLKDLRGLDTKIPIFNLWQESGKNAESFDILKKWGKAGGLAIIHYDRFRRYHSASTQLTQNNPNPTAKNKEYSEEIISLINKVFFDGPDVVVFDEGHLLKNCKTKASVAANRFSTKRRIILTGTPLQNNLLEYFTMVSLVKPKLLGTRVEFDNRFGNPIKNGAHIDSSEADVGTMKKRSHVLHTTLNGVVQRKDFTEMKPYLKKKLEYTIYVNLSEVQKELYQFYTKYVDIKESETAENGRKTLLSFLTKYGELSKICAHPYLLLASTTTVKNKKNKRRVTAPLVSLVPLTERNESTKGLISSSESSDDDDIDWLDDDGMMIVPKQKIPVVEPEACLDVHPWYKPYKEEETMFDKENIELSGKLVILMEILKVCEKIGDKVLIFSQSLQTLDLIEDVLKTLDTKRINEEAEVAGSFNEGLNGVSRMRWRVNREYFRLDGSTTLDDRRKKTEAFNKGETSSAKAFLISTKAGGLGINLTGANRVVIFEPSWNPASDLQSIFRVYRFGQKKECYVYRLLTHGTSEERIYNNQVVKLSLAGRVVDEQQIRRHFEASHTRIDFVYTPTSAEISSNARLPDDRLLADLLTTKKQWIHKYVEHDSLLADRKDEELTEDERAAAFSEYEIEKVEANRKAHQAKAKGAAGLNTTTRKNESVPKPAQSRLQNQTNESRQTSPALLELRSKFFKLHPEKTERQFHEACTIFVNANQCVCRMKNPTCFTPGANMLLLLSKQLAMWLEDIKIYFGNDVEWTSVLGVGNIDLSYFDFSRLVQDPTNLNNEILTESDLSRFLPSPTNESR